MSSRDRILGRVRAALADVPRAETPDDVVVPAVPPPTPRTDLVDLLTERLEDYRATVHRDVPAASIVSSWGRLGLADGVPAEWVAGMDTVRDADLDSAAALDELGGVVTGCAVAIAETGTLVLDGGPLSGRRVLTLVPDRHLCVVSVAQIVADVPDAMPRLDPRRPLTWVSGPSATSDIELNRVEGVHGPRTLEVLILP
jgi:L-lactate dehydrogenase complex protein LldG